MLRDGSLYSLIHGDCLEVMRSMADNSVDMVMCSPPYEAARTYGIGFTLKGQEWVDWCVERFVECVRVCKGLVVWVVEGQTRQFRYSCGPILLMADLHRKGIHLRKPPAFARVGIPGSGGPDFLRNNYEFCVCGSKGGKLPWSDNTAMGHPPKWAPGGEMSNRLSSGHRRNQWGHSLGSNSAAARKPNGERDRGYRPSHVVPTKKFPASKRSHTKSRADGTDEIQFYAPPVLANPGNIIKATVGGGVMGSKLCHKNEAPYPEKLAEFFIRSFCPPDGIVLDPFSGSGTTAAVAVRCGRRAIGIDVRESQVELGHRRMKEIQRDLYTF